MSQLPFYVPARGVIREHYDYATWATDAPPIYHVASMLTVIAACTADRATLFDAGYDQPLHLWTMLLGRSASDRKTTATKLAVRYLQEIKKERLLSIHGSPEGILGEIELHPTCLLYVPEGGAFFAQQKSNYWAHGKEMFMDIYDEDREWTRSLSKRKITLRRPRVSLLSGCAMSLLEDHTEPVDWSGGFLSRFLLVSGDRERWKAELARDPAVEDQIRGMLQTIYKPHGDDRGWGQIQCSTPARGVFTDLAKEMHACERHFEEAVSPCLNRLSQMARRIGALYEIADAAARGRRGNLEISEASAISAATLIRASRDETIRQVQSMAVSTQAHKESRRLEELILRGGPGGVRRTDLILKTRWKKKRLGEALDILLDCHRIAVLENKSTGGRPATYFVHRDAQRDAERSAEQEHLRELADLQE